MTVETNTVLSGPYAGNDVADTFAYGFTIQNKTDLMVIETDNTGALSILTVDTDYTVGDVGTEGGGSVVRVAGPLPTDYGWLIRSDRSPLQFLDLVSQGGFFPDLHEKAYDHAIILIQQILSRVVLSPPGEVATPGQNTLPAPLEDAVIGWDDLGNLINITLGNFTFDLSIETGDAGKKLIVNPTEDGVIVDDDVLEGRAVDATPSTLMLRDVNGRSKVADPVLDSDVANKGFVATNVASQVAAAVPPAVAAAVADNVSDDPFDTDDEAHFIAPSQFPALAYKRHVHAMVKCDTTSVATVTGNYEVTAFNSWLSDLSQTLQVREGDLIYIAFSGSAPDGWHLRAGSAGLGDIGVKIYDGASIYNTPETGTFTLYIVTNDFYSEGLVNSFATAQEDVFCNPAGDELYFSRPSATSQLRPKMFTGHGRDGSVALVIEPVYELTELHVNGPIIDRCIAKIAVAGSGAASNATYIQVSAFGDDIEPGTD